MSTELETLRARVAELVAALREILNELPYGSASKETLEAELKHWNPFTQNEALRAQIERILRTREALARVESAAPAKHPDTERLEALAKLGNVAIWHGCWSQHVPDEDLRGRPLVEISTMDDDCIEKIEEVGSGETLEHAIDAARAQKGTQ